MVIVLPAKEAETPNGKPVTVPIPVAPVVVCIIGVKTVLIHNVELGAAVTVLFAFTTIVPVAFIKSHPPVNGML